MILIFESLKKKTKSPKRVLKFSIFPLIVWPSFYFIHVLFCLGDFKCAKVKQNLLILACKTFHSSPFLSNYFICLFSLQNDRITKLKIDNNPFAKGFRETGQSRCKRKMSSSPTAEDQNNHHQQQQQQLLQQHHHQQQQHQQQLDIMSPTKSHTTAISESGSSICSDKTVTAYFNENHSHSHYRHHQSLLTTMEATSPSTETSPEIKRLRSTDTLCSLEITNETGSSGNMSSLDYVNRSSNIFQQQQQPAIAASSNDATGSCNATSVAFMHHFQQNMQSLLRPSLVDLACSYFARPQPLYPQHVYAMAAQHEALVAAGIPQPLPSSLQPLLPTHNNVSDMPQHLSVASNEGSASVGCSRAALPNRVMAINSNTTLECITNDADLSSSDSSLIQDEAATTTTTTTTPVTTPTPTPTMSATCNSNDDTLSQSPSANSISSNKNNSNNSKNRTSNANNTNHKKKGFSISAILGGGS